MIVYNVTRDCRIAEQGTMATNVLQRLKGLLGRDRLGPEEGMVIKPCNGVHTFMMRFPIDVLYASREGQVVRAVPDLVPNRVGPVVRQAAFVVELPAGTIAATGTQVDDQLEVRECPT